MGHRLLLGSTDLGAFAGDDLAERLELLVDQAQPLERRPIRRVQPRRAGELAPVAPPDRSEGLRRPAGARNVGRGSRFGPPGGPAELAGGVVGVGNRASDAHQITSGRLEKRGRKQRRPSTWVAWYCWEGMLSRIRGTPGPFFLVLMRATSRDVRWSRSGQSRWPARGARSRGSVRWC